MEDYITRAEKVGIIIAKTIFVIAVMIITWLAMLAIVGGWFMREPTEDKNNIKTFYDWIKAYIILKEPVNLNFLESCTTSNISTNWYKRFTGHSKRFKKNKRKGLWGSQQQK
jgi:flagellar basal body-associated protein FliL